MFLPKQDTDTAAEQKAEKERRDAYERIEGWATKAVPAKLRKDCQISVQEVQCGDPQCSPVDTAVTIIFSSGGRGMMGLPMEAKEVTEEELRGAFPSPEVLEAWHKGEEAEWPPEPEWDNETNLPKLRFAVDERVLCRIGPDPVEGWAPGKIVQLWYREPNWPVNSWAPYKIRLDDGRDIFAPGDMDQVIKKDPQGAR